MPKLTDEERARVKDSQHNIQTAATSLSQVNPKKIPNVEEITECLENADKILHDALQTAVRHRN
jgi:hypothetical protein